MPSCRWASRPSLRSGAFVNAPFFAHLNRRDMEPTVPLNALFLDTVAQVAADVLLAVEQDEVELADPPLPSTCSLGGPRRSGGCQVRTGRAQSRSRLRRPCGRRRTHIDLGWLALDARRLKVVPPQTLRAVCQIDLIDRASVKPGSLISSARPERCRSALEPGANRISSWAEVSPQPRGARHGARGLGRVLRRPALLLPSPSDLPEPPRVVLDEAGELLSDEAGSGGPPSSSTPRRRTTVTSTWRFHRCFVGNCGSPTR